MGDDRLDFFGGVAGGNFVIAIGSERREPPTDLIGHAIGPQEGRDESKVADVLQVGVDRVFLGQLREVFGERAGEVFVGSFRFARGDATAFVGEALVFALDLDAWAADCEGVAGGGCLDGLIIEREPPRRTSRFVCSGALASNSR